VISQLLTVRVRVASAVVPTLSVATTVNSVAAKLAVGVPVILQVLELILRLEGKLEALALPDLILQEAMEPASVDSAVGVTVIADWISPLFPVDPL